LPCAERGSKTESYTPKNIYMKAAAFPAST
jgi:hypothetical protein